MFKRIAVPLDGTAFGEFAIRFATEIARRAGAAIQLIHVHVPRHVEHGLFGVATFRHRIMFQGDNSVDRELFEAETNSLNDTARALAEETGIPVTGHVISGDIGEALEGEAEAFGADLMVMATHARTGLDRIRQGSIADEVVRKANMPVLLVRPPENAFSRPVSQIYRNIVVPLDGSRFSEHVLPSAATMAKLFDAKLTLVHVETPPGDRMFVGDAEGEKALAEQYRLAGRQYLERVVAQGGQQLAGAVITPVVGRFPTLAVLEAAVRADADLIAMATHGRGGLSRVLVGSTANEVLGNTWLPVLLHRPAAVEETAPVLEVSSATA